MAQYFDNSDLPSKIEEYTTNIFGVNFKFKTDNGVFSKDKLDFGTRVLLENIPLRELSGDILDVGCGYGVIDIILSKFINANFDGIDINKRALHLADINMKLNSSFGINFFYSNVYENVDKKYDFIITNPPIRAGKKTVYDILFGAVDHLKENGKMFLVIRRDQGAKSAIKDLTSLYDVEILCKKNGFFVIRCNLR